MSYEEYTKPFMRTVTDKVTGETREELMSAHEVATIRRKKQEAADLATSIARRKAAAIAEKSDRRSDLEKKRDQIANYASELREKLDWATTPDRASLLQRVAQFDKQVNELNVQIAAERRDREWNSHPQIKLMRDASDSLRSASVIYDAVDHSSPEVSDLVNLMRAVAESKDFSTPEDQATAFFEIESRLSDMNLQGHRQRTADAESNRLRADTDLAKQQLAEKQAEARTVKE